MKSKILLLLLVTVLALLSPGCSATGSYETKTLNTSRVNQSLVQGNQNFGLALLQTLQEEPENLFFSPFSISTALSMTSLGAKGETKTQMANTLGYEKVEDSHLLETYQELLSYYNGLDSKTDFLVSNSIWYRQGEAIQPEFLEKNQSHFFAKVSEMDFSKPDAADTINGWIKDSTKGLISQMIQPPIPADVVMYLINAVYFKGDWTHPFDEKVTRPETFFAYGGTEVPVDMMHRTGPAGYYQGEGYQVLNLPYGQEKLSMTLLLPDGDLLDFISSLTEDSFQKALQSPVSQEEVSIWMPRFSISYGIKELNRPLIRLGMDLPFSPSADLSGIREEIYISRVLHKAVVHVNEEGTTAAGATVVELRETAMLEPLIFRCDRPFLFLISEEDSNTILFMGTYLLPEETP
jgi:serpin B